MRKVRFIGIVFLVLLSMVMAISLFLCVRCSIEGRRVTANNMSPTLNIDERVLFDISAFKSSKQFARGQVVLFFSPYVQVSTSEIDKGLINVLDRAFAPPSLHHSPSSIKRIIGLPGDTIEVKRGVGVFVNGQQVAEPFVKEQANYDLHSLSDLGGPLLSKGGEAHPFPGKTEPIVVPPNTLFVLGDNRNQSEDSHLWGFLDQDRVMGRAILIFYPRIQLIR